MAPTPKRKRHDDLPANSTPSKKAKTYKNPPSAPATLEDKQTWQGFCEIGSDPAFFNVMLKEFGVDGVKVHEIFGLDESALASIPRPIYGIIFLFRYFSNNENKQEASCPENVWFANQVADHSCASVALLNIVNNIPDCELGEHLRSFKEFTMKFPPALRGDAIANFEFVKQIHNSFARKMDMLNVDLGLENSYDERNKRKKAVEKPKQKKKPKTKKKSSVVTEDDYEKDPEDDDSAFHFIAYVPVDGEVWKLDGLDRQPERIGEFDEEDWLSVVMPALQHRMIQFFEQGSEVNLLALVKDPLASYKTELAQNIKAIQSVQSRLNTLKADWRDSQDTKSLIFGPDVMLNITEDTLDAANIQESRLKDIEDATDDLEKLTDLHTRLAATQPALRAAVSDEIEAEVRDQRIARERRHDYGPIIATWLRMLAEKDGIIKDLLEKSRITR